MVMPGQHQDDDRAVSPIAMEDGLRFAIREGVKPSRRRRDEILK